MNKVVTNYVFYFLDGSTVNLPSTAIKSIKIFKSYQSQAMIYEYPYPNMKDIIMIEDMEIEFFSAVEEMEGVIGKFNAGDLFGFEIGSYGTTDLYMTNIRSTDLVPNPKQKLFVRLEDHSYILSLSDKEVKPNNAIIEFKGE